MRTGLEIDGDLLLRLGAHPPTKVTAREQTLVVDLPDLATARSLMRCRDALPFGGTSDVLNRALARTGLSVEARLRGTRVGTLDGSSSNLLGRWFGMPGLRVHPLRMLVALFRPA